MKNKKIFAVACLLTCISSSAFAADSPMQPGLWSMQLSGMSHVSNPPITMPMHTTTQVCVGAHQPPQKVFLQPGSDHCIGTHHLLQNGKVQWTFHCQAPNATVTQSGWFQAHAHHLNAQWTVIEHTMNGGYTVVTNLHIQGTRLSSHCGKIQ